MANTEIYGLRLNHFEIIEFSGVGGITVKDRRSGTRWLGFESPVCPWLYYMNKLRTTKDDRPQKMLLSALKCRPSLTDKGSGLKRKNILNKITWKSFVGIKIFGLI